ncbi:MAG: hypothetical protein H7338_11595 [Candidatus Sericytochromatia bacterium]|nr:hypothetical protein [Candidatus Sericytochromatia bacterium]
MLRFLTLAALTVMTSGCMVGLATLIPAGTETPTRPNQTASAPNSNQTPAAPTSTQVRSPDPAPASSSSNTQGIVGTWTTVGANGGSEAVLFRADGVVAVQNSAAPGVTLQGTYTLNGTTLIMTFPNAGATTYQVSLRDGGQSMLVGDDLYRRN